MVNFKVEYKIKNKLIPTPLESVRMLGYAGELADIFFYERVLSDNAKKKIYREAEDAFLYRVDDSELAAIWQGEYWGKWMISAARVARYTHSEELRDFMREGACRLIGYQREDGYLGTYRNSKNMLMASPEAAGTDNMNKRLNWNVWCRKYTLWGMLECYMLLGDGKMLESSVRMADHLLAELSETGIDILDTGMFAGLPSGSIMKPMLMLYRLTGDGRYLDFALDIAAKWSDPTRTAALVYSPLTGKPVSEWNERPEYWAKAYEMMSCYDGLLELYRVTGKEEYLKATVAFFDLLLSHEANQVSSVGFNDHFCDAGYDLNCSSEPCDVIHFMRVAHELFLLTGDVKYMDCFERSALTPLLASAFKDGSWGPRALRGQGRHQVATVQARFVYSHCCVNNMPRGLANMIESAVMTDGNSLYVNLYNKAEGEITVGATRVKFKIDGDYPADGIADIALCFDGPSLPVKLRIPQWSERTVIEADGVSKYANQGYYTLISSGREMNIQANFDSRVRIERVTDRNARGNLRWKKEHWAFPYNGDAVEYTSTDPALYMTGDAAILKKRPILLCRTKLIGSTEDEMFGERLLDESFECVGCERVHTTDRVNIEFILTFKKGDKVLKYHVADYASGTNIMTEDKRFFSIYF